MKERLTIEMGITIFWLEKRQNYLTIGVCTDGKLGVWCQNQDGDEEKIADYGECSETWMEKNIEIVTQLWVDIDEKLLASAKVRMAIAERVSFWSWCVDIWTGKRRNWFTLWG